MHWGSVFKTPNHVLGHALRRALGVAARQQEREEVVMAQILERLCATTHSDNVILA